MQIPDPTGSLGNLTRPVGYPQAYGGGSGRLGLLNRPTRPDLTASLLADLYRGLTKIL